MDTGIPRMNLAVNIKENHANPYPMYAELREATPVCLFNDGLYALTRFEHVVFALKSPDSFFDGASASGRGDWLPEDCDHGVFMISESPPEHGKYRSIFSKLFLPSSIKEQMDFMEKTANELLDRITPGGLFDFTKDFAETYTSRVSSKITGVDETNQRHAAVIRRWAYLSEQNVSASSDAHRAETIDITRQLNSIYESVIAENRQSSRNNIIRMLLDARIDTEPLGLKKVYAALDLFLSAGFSTAAQLISNAILELSRRRTLLKELSQDHSLLPAFIEELLRFCGPTQCVMRTTVRPVSIEGMIIPQGKSVQLMLGSANHDPRQFDSPDEFILNRPNAKKHVAFGYGIHRCLGAALVRLETEVVLRAILNRFSRFECPPADQLEWDFTLFTRGIRNLPAVFL